MAQKKEWHYDPRLRELLLAFLKMAKSVRKPYAVGGALAMSAHGYERQTSDLDAFLLDKDRLAWLRAARAVGLTVDRVFGNIHFIAFFPKHADPRVRIDMLFPADELELGAVEQPCKASIGGIEAKVFPVEFLALAKFLSDRPEDQRDFDVMFNLGLFEPETLRCVLKMFDPGSVKAYVERVRVLTAPTARR